MAKPINQQSSRMVRLIKSSSDKVYFEYSTYWDHMEWAVMMDEQYNRNWMEYTKEAASKRWMFTMILCVPVPFMSKTSFTLYIKL